MPVARFRRDGTSTAAAAVRHAATGTPPGWSQRAACRALKAGRRHDGVYAVELRPGGSVRYLLWRGGPDGQAGRAGDGQEIDRKNVVASRSACASGMHTSSKASAEETPADDDEMAVDGGNSSRVTRSQKRLANFGKAMCHVKQLVLKRWRAAVQQEKQQRMEREQAEAAARAKAAAATEAQRARVCALERELAEVRGALDAERSRRVEERRLSQEAVRERQHDDYRDAGGGETPPTVPPAPASTGSRVSRGFGPAGETQAAKGRMTPYGGPGRGKGGRSAGYRPDLPRARASEVRVLVTSEPPHDG